MNEQERQTVEAMNDVWREKRPPNELVTDAFHTVCISGSLADDTHEALVEDLWQAVPEHIRGRDFCDPRNGMASVAEKQPDGVLLRTTTKLWRMQPFGVLYDDIHDRVNGEGSAIIKDVYPRSADVADDVLPQDHMATKVVPTPMYLERFVGERGFPTL